MYTSSESIYSNRYRVLSASRVLEPAVFTRTLGTKLAHNRSKTRNFAFIAFGALHFLLFFFLITRVAASPFQNCWGSTFLPECGGIFAIISKPQFRGQNITVLLDTKRTSHLHILFGVIAFIHFSFTALDTHQNRA